VITASQIVKERETGASALRRHLALQRRPTLGSRQHVSLPVALHPYWHPDSVGDLDRIVPTTCNVGRWSLEGDVMELYRTVLSRCGHSSSRLVKMSTVGAGRTCLSSTFFTAGDACLNHLLKSFLSTYNIPTSIPTISRCERDSGILLAQGLSLKKLAGDSSYVTTRPRPPSTYPTTSSVRGPCHVVLRPLAEPKGWKGRLKAFAPTPEKPFVLGLPTGSSPEGVYKNLVAAHKQGEISFRNVVTFNMVGRNPFRCIGRGS